MNGELLHMIKIATNSNAYLNNKDIVEEDKDRYGSVNFYIMNEPSIINKILKFKGNKFELVANGEKEWYKYLSKRRIMKSYLNLGSTSSDDINLSAFANGLSKWIVVTKSVDINISWHKKWSFDEKLKKWHIEYFGVPFKLSNITHTKDSSELIQLLNNSLREISDFARKIEFDSWGEYFEKGITLLYSAPNKDSKVLPYSYSNDSHRLLQSILGSWCFGGMGSWNDSPPYYAHEKGLEEEYNRITSQLYNSFLMVLECIVNDY